MSPEEPVGKRIPPSTACARKNGRRTIAQKAEDQRYLTRKEEQVLLSSIRTQLEATGCIQAGQVRKLASDIKRRRARNINADTVAQSIATPGNNWPACFLKAHNQELGIKNVLGIGWLVVDADFIATPSDLEQLCLECASINLRLERVLPRKPCKSRKIHTFANLPEGDEITTCKLCSFVLLCAKSWDWPPANKLSLYSHEVNSIFGPTLAKSKVIFSISTESDPSKAKRRGWIIPTLISSDPNEDTGPIWGHLSEAADFDKMRNWLRFCDQNHRNDCRMTELDKIPHFWLIDCATRAIVHAPDQTEYAALSYCWGDSSEPPRENLRALPTVAELVIEDALKVTQALGIRYLWVDRYCNSQSDPSILPTQLQNMHKVYRSAYVTIITGCGDDSEFGLPGVSTRSRKPSISLQTHGHHLRCIPDIEQEIHACRWSTRGWTYQENLLSKRRLVFTETQTYFQCWNMHCCESTPPDLEEAHTKDLTRFKECMHTLRVFPQKGIGKTSDEVEQRIQEYLCRDFTKDYDALNALLGVFQAFRELENPVHDFWGLPMSGAGRSTLGTGSSPRHSCDINELLGSFLSSLAWSMDTCDNASLTILKRRNMFPSWTWAAWTNLPTFARKRITDTRHCPCISFKTYQEHYVRLWDLERALGPGDSAVLFEPCIYLDGWVTTVRLMQTDSENDCTSCFQVSWPISTHRVAVVADTEEASFLQQYALTGSFRALLLGSESTPEEDAVTSRGGVRNMHAILLQVRPDGTHTRLGVVTWSCLGKPSFHDGGTVMRCNELFEARRVIPRCHCGCTTAATSSFDHYLEDPNHVLEFRKAEIRLV